MTWSTMPVVGRTTTRGSAARTIEAATSPNPSSPMTVERGEGAAELVVLPDGDRAPGGVGDVDDPEMHGADGILVVVEQPQQLELGRERRHDLLAPLSPQPAQQVAVAGVEVSADADRPAVVQPGVPAGARATHEEDARAIAQHEVWDDLLPGRVRLQLPARSEDARRRDGLEMGLEIVPAPAPPGDAARQARSRDGEDQLVVAGHVTSPARCAPRSGRGRPPARGRRRQGPPRQPADPAVPASARGRAGSGAAPPRSR